MGSLRGRLRQNRQKYHREAKCPSSSIFHCPLRTSFFLSLCQSLDGDGLRIEQWRIPFAESSLFFFFFFPGKWERSTGKYFGRRAPLCRPWPPGFSSSSYRGGWEKSNGGRRTDSGGGLRYNPHPPPFHPWVRIALDVCGQRQPEMGE